MNYEDKIVKELENRRDQGGLFFQSGSLTATETVFNLYADFHFCTKGYKIINDGTHDLQIAHTIDEMHEYRFNLAPEIYQTVRPATLDVVPHTVRYNTKVIYRIALRSEQGTNFRLWTFW